MAGYSRLHFSGILLGLVIVTMACGLPVTAAMQNATPQTIMLHQGDKCITLEPLGDGTQTVEEFYDYRSSDTDPSGDFTSYGTRDIQLNDTSQVFVYRGSDGLSLVFLHDKIAGADHTSGGTITAEISGLPPDGEWVVEDDDYSGRDDEFAHNGSLSYIVWKWNNGNRTDGAAFRGLERDDYDRIRIDMRFNEDSDAYPFRKWESPPEENHIDSWVARSAGGETTELDMDDPITIEPGHCDSEPPEVDLAIQPTDPEPGELVRLDAGNTTDESGIEEYRWDLDGDGTTDEITTVPTVTTTFDTSGSYTVRVTAVDAANNSAMANATITVAERETVTTTRSSTHQPTTTVSDTIDPQLVIGTMVVGGALAIMLLRNRRN